MKHAIYEDRRFEGDHPELSVTRILTRDEGRDLA